MVAKLIALCSPTLDTSGRLIQISTFGSGHTSAAYSGGWFNAEYKDSDNSVRLGLLRAPILDGGVHKLSPYIGSVLVDGPAYDVCLTTRFKYDHTSTPADFTICGFGPEATLGEDASNFLVILRMLTDNTISIIREKPNPYPGTWTQLANPTFTFAENTEYTLEFRCIFGSSDDQDYWGAFVNGTLLAEGYADLSWTGKSLAVVRLGPFADGTLTTESSVVVSFKDIALFRDGRPEPGRVAVMVPNANGTYTAWTGSYTDVDEYPTDNDTTYITSSTNGQKESYTFNTDTSGAPVDGIQPFFVYRIETNSRWIRLFSIINSVESWRWPSTGGIGDPSYDSVYTTMLADNPESAAPWTASDLSSMQLGLELSSGTGTGVRVTTFAVMAWVRSLTANLAPVVIRLSDPIQSWMFGAIDPVPVVVRLADPGQGWLVEQPLDPVVISLTDPGQTWAVNQPIEPIVISLVDPAQTASLTISPIPVQLRLTDPGASLSMGQLDLQPVVLRMRVPAQGAGLTRLVLPTARGKFWVVSATAPPYPQEGYVWVSIADPAAPVMYQYLAGAWSALLGGFDEATTRIVFDAGAASTSATPVSLANLTGLNIPADEHIIIEATIVNVNGAFDITGLSVELNNVAIMSGVAMPGTGTGEAGTWRVIIPRRDQAASLGGYSYLTITDSASQTVTALTNVPQNVPITSIELIADPNSTSMELRNVLVRTFKS